MLHILSTDIFNALQHFARGGGGGSGGGGGGGGGGSGGSGGGGGGLLFAGYFPAHLFGSFLRRKMHNPVGLIIMVLASVLYGSAWFFLGSVGVLIGLGAFLGGPVGYFGLFGKISGRLVKKNKAQIAAAALNDPAWDPIQLEQHVKNVFTAFQQDWSTFNIDSIKTYLSPEYANHTQLMLLAIKQRQRRNAVENPQIIEIYPTAVQDFPDNTQDQVTYLIHAKANDKILETIDGQETELYQDNNEFYEYWNFIRSGNTWLLNGISQQTENAFLLSAPIVQFAQQEGFYYSPDWGWLLLPRRGQLFGKGKFGVSDINNHVIGLYKNILVELYTYIPNPKSSDQNSSQYIIAQVALPKRYDSLIVEAKSSWLGSIFGGKPRGYNKLSLEWADFNKRYNVYATNVEQVTAFELLHPVYMEKLFALPFKVSIEVVDNVVYLYTRDKKADYATMYSILQDAFEEMKL